ncbi:MAG: antibiotic biosynthesis monooxygenase [Planctomycetaceae bacterium]|nr:antibiotic biosynthesis monooxygenase [Planctomycetaceae bacterium]
MPELKELDHTISLSDQMQSGEQGHVVLINMFHIAAEEEDALIEAWSHDAEFMKQQPGYISTQLHKGIAGSLTLMNYAIWESVESFRAAFTNPEFQKHIAAYPSSAVVSPHLFKKVAVDGLCVD